MLSSKGGETNLAQYDFTVAYKPGRNNGNADGLSPLAIEDCQLNHLFLNRADAAPSSDTTPDHLLATREVEQEELKLLKDVS